MNFYSKTLVILCGMTFLVTPAFADTLDEPMESLNASDWSSIRAAYEARRHDFHEQEDGSHAARNPGQQWRSEFDGRGFLVRPDHGRWTWGLELRSIDGRPAVPVTGHGAGTTSKNRLSYDWNAGVEEWFLNDGRGLEQGWTISARDEYADAARHLPFQLDLSVRGSLVPQISPDGRSVAFRAAGDDAAALRYGGLKAWDAKGRDLPVWFAPSGVAGTLSILVDDAGAAYPITVDPVAQQAYLKASNPGISDRFGASVAVSGDTVVVGAPYEGSSATGIDGDGSDNSAPDSGAAYVFVRSGTTWSQQAYLKASNTDSTDGFGTSVAISGDAVVVGAPAERSSATGIDGDGSDNSAERSGAAYVFVRSGTAWSQQAYLKASNTGEFDWFGASVTVSGDTVVVGALFEASSATGIDGDGSDNSASSSGAAYVFVRSGTAWSQQAYLKAYNTGSSDTFGTSLAVSGDTVVVGAPQESSSATGIDGDGSDNSATYSGAAYVFVRSGTTWSQQAYLKASNTGSSDRFGTSVAVSGDTVVVGAHGEDSSATGIDGDGSDNSASSSGAAYVFVRSGTTWSQQAYLKASNPDFSDEFGTSLAVSGDTVVVGAPYEESSASGIDGDGSDNSVDRSGAAYVFVRNGTTWSQQAYLKASNTGIYDEFGTSVAVSGDTVVVGAWYEDSSATGVDGNANDNGTTGAGAAYVFTSHQGFIQHTISTTASGTLGGVPFTNEAFSLVSFSDPNVDTDPSGSGDHTLPHDRAEIRFEDFMGNGPRVIPITSSTNLFVSNDAYPVSNIFIFRLGGNDLIAVSDSAFHDHHPADPVGPVNIYGGTVLTPAISTSEGNLQFDFSTNGTFVVVGEFVTFGEGLSASIDTDGDGLNDAAEYALRSLGFDWQVATPNLVALVTGAGLIEESELESAGYFTASQLQALHAPTPLISRDPGTGAFTLRMDWKKSIDLQYFDDFPASASQISVNPEGDIEFEFLPLDDAAFFKVEVE